MFIHKTLTAMLIGVLLFGNIIAQQAGVSTPKTPEISPELRKNAVDFLRQTIKEIPNLKAEENRQYFTIEMARLLWKYDEKEARAMFERMIQEVSQSITKISEKYKKAVEELKKARKNSNANYGYYNPANRPATNAYPSNRIYTNSANSNVYVEPEISVYEAGMGEEFSKLASLYQNLITNLTEVEPVLAYKFLSETRQNMPKGVGRYGYSELSRNFERQIVVKLLEKNEVDKSVEIARSVLNKDFSESFLNILRAIYEKDATKGSALTEETLQKLKTLNTNDLRVALLVEFFDTAIENNNQPQPMLSDKSLRELARMLGNNVLSAMDRETYITPYYYSKKIEKYAPREALKILQKSKQKRYVTNANRYVSNAPYYISNAANRAYPANYPINYASNVANKAANRPAANVKPKPQITPTPQETKIGDLPGDFPNEVEIIIDSKAELMKKLSIGKFTKDEREKAIKQAKEYAFSQNYWGYARPDRFISVVGELARFSIISADKEISESLMKEAETYVRPETKHALDYAGKLFLAGGYSRHQPNKSFALMESMFSINEYIESAVKLGTFFDFETMYVPNDEVSAPFFFSEMGFSRFIFQTEELQIFLQNLANADFQRTKGLAEKFNRTEVKMTAKMLILESLLGEHREYEDVGY